MKRLTHLEVIELLKKRQGDMSLRGFASELGISAVYLMNIYKQRRDPGPAVLEKLGLRREIVYLVALR